MAGVSLALLPLTALAHHALQSQFDTNQTITLAGTVSRMDWSNPHVRLFVNVAQNEKKTATWELYMGSPNLQMMKGLKIDTYRKGDPVRIEAYPARNGSKVAFATKVTVVAASRLGEH